MLELRPTCEHCNKALPPSSPEAMICSFECTFCADCVARVLDGVCPNCGGNLCPRPIRPERAWRMTLSVEGYPPSETVKHRPVQRAAHRDLVARVRRGAPSRAAQGAEREAKT